MGIRKILPQTTKLTDTNNIESILQIDALITFTEKDLRSLIDQLDAASMRRFDIKLHFGYMLPEQIRRMLRAYCQSMNLPAPSHSDLVLAAAMDCAAPGDFAAAARRHRFEPFPDSHSFIRAVADECEHKSSHARRIGFN